MDRACRGLGTGLSRPRPTEHAPPPHPLSSIPRMVLTGSRTEFSTRSPDVQKASPSGQGAAAHPTLEQPGLPKSGVAPHPPPLRSSEFLSSPQVPSSPLLPQRPSTLVPPLGPSALARRVPPSRDESLAETPAPPLFPAPTPATAPAPPTRARPNAPYLAATAARLQPSSSRQALDLPFHLHTHPSFPRAQSFLKRNGTSRL